LRQKPHACTAPTAIFLFVWFPLRGFQPAGLSAIWSDKLAIQLDKLAVWVALSGTTVDVLTIWVALSGPDKSFSSIFFGFFFAL
jgi:hypothetical protein